MEYNDEFTGLIRFVRGEDYFDYDGDCDLREPRKRTDDNGKLKNAYIADIYNSELAIVGNLLQVYKHKRKIQKVILDKK